MENVSSFCEGLGRQEESSEDMMIVDFRLGTGQFFSQAHPKSRQLWELQQILAMTLWVDPDNIVLWHREKPIENLWVTLESLEEENVMEVTLNVRVLESEMNAASMRDTKLRESCYRPDDNLPLDRIVRVTFQMPDGSELSKIHPVRRPLWEVRDQLAQAIWRQPESLTFFYKGEALMNEVTLAGLEVGHVSSLTLQVRIPEEEEPYEKRDVEEFRENRREIAVRFFNNNNEIEVVNVTVTNEGFVREWEGGYRDKNTNTCYHNASTMTLPRPKMQPLHLSHRDAQTPYFPLVVDEVNTDHSVATQTWRSDLYISSIGEKIIWANYFTSWDIVIAKSHILNHFYILNRFKRRVNKIISERKFIRIKNLEEEKQKESKKKQEEEFCKSKKEYLIAVPFPAKRVDFQALYNVVNKWSKGESDRAKKELTASQKTMKLKMIFETKLKLLKQIEVLRSRNKDESLQRRIRRELEIFSRPKVRLYESGSRTLVETMDIQRNREFKEIFSNYLREDYTKEERLDMLKELIETLDKYEEVDHSGVLPLTIALINREIHMLMMGMGRLDGLRKRIVEQLYLFWRSEVRGRIVEESPYLCRSCKKWKRGNLFEMSALSPSLVCKECRWLKKKGVLTPSMIPYQKLLRILRQEECDERLKWLTLLLQPADLCILVQNVWGGRSCLSDDKQLLNLRLPRFDKTQPWTPWNCILLTKTEADMFVSIPDPQQVFSAEFILSLKRKMTQAKQKFGKLLTILELCETDKFGIFAKSLKNYLPGFFLEEFEEDPVFRRNPLRDNTNTCIT